MARNIKSIAVFCGSNTGAGEAYVKAADALGREIARRGLRIVYGGTHKGLMGALANGALAAGGEVFGIITKRLRDRGHLYEALTRSEIVDTMSMRKARMAAEADAFIALPGGIGTLEEFMEVWTLNQLGEIDKPAGLLDTAGYYQPFMAFIDHMIAQSFLPAAHRKGIVLAAEPAALIDGLLAFEPVTAPKWMDEAPR